MLKIDNVKAGDVVKLDEGFTCHPGGTVTISKDPDGLFFECDEGHHYLDGQVDDNGCLVGISKA